MGICNERGDDEEGKLEKVVSDQDLIKKLSKTDGHSAIETDGYVIKKDTKKSEADHYERIFDHKAHEDSVTKMRPFLPVYFGSEKKNSNRKWIYLENLFEGRQHASSIDMKLGTCLVTPSHHCCKR